jgi:hypothetical protein
VKGSFYDYDLPGAYPTAMSLLDYADWSRQETINFMEGRAFINKYGLYLMQSFTALKVEFSFSESVHYPNLPVRVDKSAIIFPKSGISFCTGLEILLAYRLGCDFTVLGGSFIPFLSLEMHKDVSELTMSTSDTEFDSIFEPQEKTVDVHSPELVDCYNALESNLKALEIDLDRQIKLKRS